VSVFDSAHARLLAKPGHILAADPRRPVLARHRVLSDFVGCHRLHGAQQLGALVAHAGGLEAGAGLHGDSGHHLQQMVLDHVGERAGLLVISAAALDADRFRGGDLHMVDVAAVPERLEDPIAEAESQDVLHRLLAQVMIDAVDVGFGEDLVQVIAKLAGAGQIMAEGFFDDQPAPAGPCCKPAAPMPCAARAYWLGWVER
jgi:hypothetical protein